MAGVDLSVELCGLRLANPLVVASGVLGTSIGLMRRAESHGAAAIVSKTVTAEPRAGSPNPVVVELPYGLVNSMGLPNPGAREMAEILARAKSSLRVPLIASLGPRNAEEAAWMAELFSHVDALELNCSCPHASGLGLELASDPELLVSVVRGLGSSRLPLLVKLSPHMDYVRLAGRLLDAGASGFVAVNTLKAMVINVWARRPVLGGVYGGLSGPALHPVAVRVVYELHAEYPGVPIVGVGGVETWADAVELILAGASAVGMASGLRRGFQVIGEVVEGLRRYLLEEGFSSVREIVGLAHP